MRRRGRCVCGNPDCDWQPVPGGPGHPPRDRDRQQDDTQAWDEEVRRFWTPGARISDPFASQPIPVAPLVFIRTGRFLLEDTHSGVEEQRPDHRIMF